MVSKAEIRSTLIEHGKFKIMIMNAPNDDNAAQYILELKNVGVTDVVRTCEPTYSTASFEKAGITVHEMTFPDGAQPPDDIINRWNELVRRRYKPKKLFRLRRCCGSLCCWLGPCSSYGCCGVGGNH